MNSHSIWENSMGFGPVSVTPGLVTHMEVIIIMGDYCAVVTDRCTASRI